MRGASLMLAAVLVVGCPMTDSEYDAWVLWATPNQPFTHKKEGGSARLEALATYWFKFTCEIELGARLERLEGWTGSCSMTSDEPPSATWYERVFLTRLRWTSQATRRARCLTGTIYPVSGICMRRQRVSRRTLPP